MSSKLIQPPPSMAASRGAIPIRRTRNAKILFSLGNLYSKTICFTENPSRLRPMFIGKVSEQSSVSSPNEQELQDEITVSQIKQELYEALKGINRGIFGVKSDKKTEIEDLVNLLERRNPTPEPTEELDKIGGCWKLVYSTITVLGSKRTKLGLRSFVSLGDLLQQIDIAQGKTVHVLKFDVRGLNLLDGEFRIVASFEISSKSSVEITYESSTIKPDQLMNIFRKNMDLLLGIFNPEGRFEISCRYILKNLILDSLILRILQIFRRRFTGRERWKGKYICIGENRETLKSLYENVYCTFLNSFPGEEFACSSRKF